MACNIEERTWDEATACIEELAVLRANWDGEGANALARETVANALAFACLMQDVLPPPTVHANPNGTVSFEWERPGVTAYWEVGRTTWGMFLTVAGTAGHQAVGKTADLHERAEALRHLAAAIGDGPTMDLGFGPVTVATVYEAYDGPKLFRGETPTASYLVFWAATDAYPDRWLSVRVSDERLEALTRGTMRLRSALQTAEDGVVQESTRPEATAVYTVRALAVGDLVEDDLPAADARLTERSRLSNAALNHLEVLHAMAERQRAEQAATLPGTTEWRDDLVPAAYSSEEARYWKAAADAAMPLVAELRQLRAFTAQVAALIRESDGVVGYHLNGAVATWDELGLVPAALGGAAHADS